MDYVAIIMGVIGITGWFLVEIHPALAAVPLTGSLLAIILALTHRLKNKETLEQRIPANLAIFLGLGTLVVLVIISFITVSAPDKARDDYYPEGAPRIEAPAGVSSDSASDPMLNKTEPSVKKK